MDNDMEENDTHTAQKMGSYRRREEQGLDRQRGWGDEEKGGGTPHQEGTADVQEGGHSRQQATLGRLPEYFRLVVPSPPPRHPCFSLTSLLPQLVYLSSFLS